MELLTTKHPMLRSIHGKSTMEILPRLIDTASEFNIATGFISSESLVELQRISSLRNGKLYINLFIGMNYLSGFTSLQYRVLERLSEYLTTKNVGTVYLSPKTLFHGKMYSFTKQDGECLGSIIGSSNLANFLGVAHSNIETNVLFGGDDAFSINKHIKNIIHDIGIEFSKVKPLTNFLPPEKDLLKGHENVHTVSTAEYNRFVDKCTGSVIEIPLKAHGKSNLNPYFGQGKVRGRYSPRSWYEVELIIPKHTPNIDILPDKTDGPFTVITPNLYAFQCERQGDYSKNLRSSKDLKILGKWIKGEMENYGVIECGQLVTEETLKKFGKTKVILRESENNHWLISLE